MNTKQMSIEKKIGLTAILGYVAFWVYNNVYKATDRLIFGSIDIKKISFSGGSIILPFPISNVGQIPLKMSGMVGQLILLNQYAVGEIQQVQATTFSPNTTQTLQIRISPNWITLLAVVGAGAKAAIQSGRVGEVFAQFQPRIKGTIYTPAFTQTFEKQIA